MSAPANIPNTGGPGPPNVNINAFVDAIMRQALNQLPLAHVAQISAQLLNQVRAIVRRHALALAGTLFSAAGLAVLLPSLTLVVVNALGFTSSGVLLGSCSYIMAVLSHVSYQAQLSTFIRQFGRGTPIVSIWCIHRRRILCGAVVRGYGSCCIACSAGHWIYSFGRRCRALWLEAVEVVQ
jgi:hypothetical protein